MKIRLGKAKPDEQKLWDAEVAPRLTGDEGKDRLMIQEWIGANNFRPSVMYDGNTVVRKDKIVNEFKRLLKQGTLSRMTDHFYNFLTLDAGSIAHFDKKGWIATYNNDVDWLCDFFLSNEFGRDIVSHQPGWKTDCIEIGKELLTLVKAHKRKSGTPDVRDRQAAVHANAGKVLLNQFGW